ncbi:MAG: hypothetical protein ACYC1K_03545 [Minisyncoccota bacterium]
MANVPAHLRDVVLDDATKKLAGGSGGLRISIKGGVWRMLNDGEEIQKNEDRALNVVVVASSPDTARTFYKGAWVEGESSPPVCWSLNGIAPEAESTEKQSKLCLSCPQNIAGSGQDGSRACRYSRSLAVTLENDLDGKVFKIQLPAQSLFGKIENNVAPLQAYGKQLVAHNTPISAVVTEMRFDTSSATPKLGFKAVRYLTAVEYEIAKTQGQSPEALEATKTTAYAQDNGGSNKLDIQGTSPVEKQAEKPEEKTEAAAAPVTRRRANKPAVEPETVTVTPVAEPEPEDEMSALQAKMDAMKAAKKAAEDAKVIAAVSQEPVVMTSTKPEKAIPVTTAQMLANWDDDE